MNLNLKRGLGALLVGASAVGLAAVAASPALADTTPFNNNVGPLLGKMYLSPNGGTGTTTFTLNTDGACPATASAINGLIYHQDTNVANGLPADSKNDWNDLTLVSKTTNGFSASGPMTVGITNSLYGTANGASKNMQSGTYTVDLVCRNSTNSPFGYFQATLNLANTGGAASQTATYTSQGEPTSTAVTLNPTSSTEGDTVTATASVTPTIAGLPDALTGSVQFFDGTTSLGTSTLDSTGNASLPVSTLVAGSHSITAKYLGSNVHASSTSPAATETVAPAPAAATTSALAVAVNGANVTSPATAQNIDNVGLNGTVANTKTGGATPVGSCQFFDGASPLGTAPVAADGTCNDSLGQMPAKAYSITMKFTPTDPSKFVASATTSAFSLTVTAPLVAPSTQTVNVTMDAGALTIGLKAGQTGIVNLATPVLRSDAAYFESFPQATGNVNLINSVVVSDNRAGNPGWEVRGIMSDFKAGSNLIRGNNLGWTPQPVASKAPGQNITVGAAVAPATPPLAPSDPASTAGLGSSRQLAIAAAGAGLGTAQLDANLSLTVPSSTPAGNYSGTLTLTVS